MKSADILAAFGMEPAAAVAFLRGKGYVISDSWTDVWQEAHTRAFTVAHVATTDVLEDIREAVDDALASGKTVKQFKDALTPTLQAKGWWGKAVDQETGEILKAYPGTIKPVQLGSPRRLEIIYQTNMQTAFQAGRYKGMKAAVVTHPYWQYVAVMDNRTRPDHRSLDGMVLRHDDAIWDSIYPPNGFRCRCRVRPVSEAALHSEGWGVVSSDGYIQRIEVPKSKRNPQAGTATVTRFQHPSMPKPFITDPGWDYNPATGKKAA